ncbi:MAG: hypothetical protein AB8B68_04010 [Rickettsiaceae bacterium]
MDYVKKLVLLISIFAFTKVAFATGSDDMNQRLEQEIAKEKHKHHEKKKHDEHQKHKHNRQDKEDKLK